MFSRSQRVFVWILIKIAYEEQVHFLARLRFLQKIVEILGVFHHFWYEKKIFLDRDRHKKLLKATGQAVEKVWTESEQPLPSYDGKSKKVPSIPADRYIWVVVGLIPVSIRERRGVKPGVAPHFYSPTATRSSWCPLHFNINTNSIILSSHISRCLQ
jgi:hypothetical protein